ncbi:MAG: CRISPR-associated endonuclease Cas2 [Clostridia bacterium]|nr:CRISPR-associated endonuclease Cas2 [Clostridia bacterium]
MVTFDIPQKCKSERREYSRFRRLLKKRGYQMMQNSVYVKHLRNDTSIVAEERFIDTIAPKKGNLAILRLTKAQFHSISVIRGSSKAQKVVAPVLFF